MNTTILIIISFSIGLAFGSAFFAVCNTKAFEFQDNPTTRFQLQQQRQEMEQLRQQQEMYRQEQRRNPCP